MKLSSVITAHLLAIASGAFFVMIAWAGFEYWKNAQTAQEILGLEQTQAAEMEKLEQFKTQEQIYPKIQSEGILSLAESKRILWSKVLEDVLKYQTLDLRFNSFSSDSQKLISINGWGRSMEGITQFLENLKKDSQIKSPFFGNVSRSSSSEEIGFTFTLSFYYEDLP